MSHHAFFNRLFPQSVAVDLGTANTLIYARGKGIVLNQPSVVCFQKSADAGRSRVTAVGDQAKQLIGRSPGNVEAIRPMRHGVIANFSAAEHMFREFVDMAQLRSLFGRRAEFTICVPSNATDVERRAIREAALAAGASRVTLIGESLAAAVGAGLPVSEARGSMVVDIGGGTTEVGVVSLGGIAYQTSVRVGGDQFDAAIIGHVRSVYGVLIGDQTAEVVKKTIGTATANVAHERMRAVGRSLTDGLPRTIELSNHDVAEAVTVPLKAVIGAVKNALENAPPELVTDIADTGIVLTGGGALLAHLDQRLAEETGLVVRVANEPLTCAVRGASAAAGCVDSASFLQ
ncbi:rod shape-determining protein [Trinickia dinghuensis]|uniref:Cell shape-determining protein MreB n=1 Tax=Trinickia dinghuensis TaxID=2291023 RepID=A0A3D8JT48_9BURK|nr:rod shape-determining protein [Trinickia dinghuensis]RDU96309.1 rod shape-determining protein [Trinickia dinghuensis]